MGEPGFNTYQDAALANPPEEPEPWEGRTCGECDYCRVAVGGSEPLCLLEVVMFGLGGDVVVVGEDDEACEGFSA